jgi:hypothetical protein
MGDTTPQDRAIAVLNEKFNCANGAIGLDPPELRHLTAVKTTGPGLFDWQKLTLGEIVDCLAEAGLLVDPAKVKTLGLSHALLLNGYRGYADQVNAMARQIQEQGQQLALAMDTLEKQQAFLSEAREVLERVGCQFDMCTGPTVAPIDMRTCFVCEFLGRSWANQAPPSDALDVRDAVTQEGGTHA